MSKTNSDNKKSSILSVIKSILAAGIGVQTEKNRQHDFENGNPLAFIVGGIIFTLLLIVIVATVVGLVLSNN